MKGWLIALIFAVGLVLGALGSIFAPRYVTPYLPSPLGGKVEGVEGKVVAKRREGDRLLLTVRTPQGAILATFKEKVAEIDLLVDKGDALTLALHRYEPFVEDPAIVRVKKEEVKPPPERSLPPPEEKDYEQGSR